MAHFSLSARGVPDAEATLRGMRHEAQRVAARYPALSALHFALRAQDAAYEAHVDLRLPQHQVILNAVAATPDAAVRRAAESIVREMRRLEARDRWLASLSLQPQAA